MKPTLALLTALLLAPLAAQAQTGENPGTRHRVDSGARGRDRQPSEAQNLWDYGAIAKETLDLEMVSSRTQDGYKIDAIYINGAGKGEKGKDRIFCYYVRPLEAGRKVPALIDLTGGSQDDGKALYLAKKIRGACIELEWRCAEAAVRSKWADGEPPPYRSEGPLESQQIYRVTTAARRALDFISQDETVDLSKVASVGGSMGGYLTLMLAALDARVTAAVVDVAGGHLDNSNCEQGVFWLSPEAKKRWLQAFDPYRYANRIRAKTIMLLSTCDHFFSLEDCLATYRAIPAEKRLWLDVNFDHTVASFDGCPKYEGLDRWLEYAFGRMDSYPVLAGGVEREDNRFWIDTGGMEVKDVVLAWSAGADTPWQSRYWQEIKAVQEGHRWTATIPSAYDALPKWVFMNVSNTKGQGVSAEPVFVPPVGEGGKPTLWDGGNLWDVAAGLRAWRPAVSGDPKVPRKANIAFSPPQGISVGPDRETFEAGRKHAERYPGEYGKNTQQADARFIVLTSSFNLPALQAGKHAGLAIEIDGNGSAGELKIILHKQYLAAVGAQAFETVLKYERGCRTYAIPWTSFRSAKAPGRFPDTFETLWLEGDRPDGTPVIIRSILFAGNLSEVRQTGVSEK